MTQTAQQSWRLQVLCLLCLFVLPATTDGATLPSSASASATSSASGSGTKEDFSKPRAVRSAPPLIEDESRLDGGEQGDEKGGCSSDFVEKFFRLLSGPVGKEAEAVVAAVIKLISENDRGINWPAMAHPASEWQDVQEEDSVIPASLRSNSVIPASLRSKDFLLGSQANDADADPSSSLFAGGMKRQALQFNPSGWRRKRDTREITPAAVRRLLFAIAQRYRAERRRNPTNALPEIAELSDDVSPKMAPGKIEWAKKRSGQRRVWRRLSHKRKPLEFNPSGW